MLRTKNVPESQTALFFSDAARKCWTSKSPKFSHGLRKLRRTVWELQRQHLMIFPCCCSSGKTIFKKTNPGSIPFNPGWLKMIPSSWTIINPYTYHLCVYYIYIRIYVYHIILYHIIYYIIYSKYIIYILLYILLYIYIYIILLYIYIDIG